MGCRRLLTLGPDNEPMWVRLYVNPVGDKWAAMLVADGAEPPQPGELKGTGFFGDTAEEAGGGIATNCLPDVWGGVRQ